MRDATGNPRARWVVDVECHVLIGRHSHELLELKTWANHRQGYVAGGTPFNAYAPVDDGSVDDSRLGHVPATT